MGAFVPAGEADVVSVTLAVAQVNVAGAGMLTVGFGETVMVIVVSSMHPAAFVP